jgi:hypothetical protein
MALDHRFPRPLSGRIHRKAPTRHPIQPAESRDTCRYLEEITFFPSAFWEQPL